jgi:hypothetical protein
VTQRNFTVDVSSPNDVCYLLREFGRAPCLVVDHVERLGRRQRRLLMEFLRISAEAGVVQVVLVASAADLPLDYGERVALNRYLTAVAVPPLSRTECDAFVAAYLAAQGAPAAPEVADTLFDVFGGLVESTRVGCDIAVKRRAAGAANPALRDGLVAAIQEQTQTAFLALMSAVIEAEWTLTCSRPVSYTADQVSWVPRGDLPIDPALKGDGVFRRLYDRLAKEEDEDNDGVSMSDSPSIPDLPKAVAHICETAVELGGAVLATATAAERVRLLAYAIETLLQDPMAPVTDAYERAFANETQEFNAGRVLAELLLGADPSGKIEVTNETLAARFRQDGWEMSSPRRYGKPDFPRLARRLRRLQRRLGLQPPVFEVSDDNARIVLWQPHHGAVFGDVRPALQVLLKQLDDDGD